MTPLRRQYLRLKRQHPDTILFFRLGDFYETFDDDAERAARLLQITLTSREMGRGNRVPMAGVPAHAADTYIARLIAAGERVAVCEQVAPESRSPTPSSQVATPDAHDGRGGARPVRQETRRGARRASASMMERKVVRVVTPGTVAEPDMLTAARNNYLCAVAAHGRQAGLAYADVSTGEFAATQFGGEQWATELRQELDRLQPAEVLVPKGDSDGDGLPDWWPQIESGGGPLTGLVTPYEPWRFDPTAAEEELLARYEVASLEGFGLDRQPAAVAAAGALVTYLEQTHARLLTSLAEVRSYNPGRYVTLDTFTRHNLEILEPAQRAGGQMARPLAQSDTARRGGAGGRRQEAVSTLVSVVDGTRTPLGARLLRRWLNLPLRDLEALGRRHDIVAALVGNGPLRADLSTDLRRVGDLERLTNRVVQGSAPPNALVAIRESLLASERLRRPPPLPGGEGRGEGSRGKGGQGARREDGASAAGADVPADASDGDVAADSPSPQVERGPGGEAGPGEAAQPDGPLAQLLTAIDPCPEVAALIERALVAADDESGGPDAVGPAGEGRLIRPGFSAELDELVTGTAAARKWIASLEGVERRRTGIKSLRVGYNKIFGYYIQVSNAYRGEVPAEYVRRQTLTEGERYITPELKEYETRVLTAQERIAELERDLYARVLKEIASYHRRLQRSAAALAQLDVLLGFADLAVQHRYVRPALDESGELEIVAGRHPVVEAALERALAEDRPGLTATSGFVANDCRLDTADRQIVLLTGPNMAGKSTYLRMVALIALLAQVGCFVPADRARIGLVDRIFTRVGAQDDLATGRSTFMVEMLETATILRHATPQSLILLDEIGRGTSTYDGLAIAQAVVEYLHNHPDTRARTLFATHYHELTELERALPQVHTARMDVREEGDQVIFLHRVVPGSADRSYGIHVARLAGVPRAVIRRAEEVLHTLEDGARAELPTEPAPRARQPAASPELGAMQLSLFAPPHAVVEQLKQLDVMAMTPLEALTKLHELQQSVQDE